MNLHIVLDHGFPIELVRIHLLHFGFHFSSLLNQLLADELNGKRETLVDEHQICTSLKREDIINYNLN